MKRPAQAGLFFASVFVESREVRGGVAARTVR